MNRNVLDQLILHWLKSDYKIIFEEAFRYPPAKILPSLYHADGTKQSSSKSDLLTSLDIQYSPANVIQDHQQSSFVLDVMAAIFTARNLKTIEELTWKTVNTITAEYKRVDLVAGRYQKASWKKSTCKNRSSGEEIMINLLKVKSEIGNHSWNAPTTNSDD